MEFKHKPVLLQECIEGLNIKKDGIYVDGTLGGAGHSLQVAKRLENTGNLIGIDRDKDALKKAKDTLKIITPLTDFPSQSIADNLKFSTNLQGTVSDLNYNELMYNLIAPGKEVTMNSIKIVGSTKEGSSKDNTESSEPKTYLKLGNLVIFKDDKFVDWTTEEESFGINIINNKITELYIKIKMLSYGM